MTRLLATDALALRPAFHILPVCTLVRLNILEAPFLLRAA